MKSTSVLILFLIIYKLDYIISLSCLDVIKQISNKDRCLSSRGELQSVIAANSNSLENFVDLMRNQTCTGGSYFNSYTTMQWISEIFEGIQNYYIDYVNKTNTFKHLIGDDIVKYFTLQNSSQSAYFYALTHKGSQNQTFVIEQLINNTGWRIYQSYENVYTLNAWLSQNISKLIISNDNNTDIYNSSSLLSIASNFLTKHNKNFTQSNFTTLNGTLSGLIPYLKYLQSYNTSVILDNFYASWSTYGQGKVLDWNQFNSYLTMLSNMTKYFNDMSTFYSYLNKSDSSVLSYNQSLPQFIWDDWVQSYGSILPLYYPNVSNFLIVESMAPEQDQTYDFQVKTFALPDYNYCMINNVFMNYLTTGAGFINLSFSIFIIFSILL
jgi:hypothetical protein